MASPLILALGGTRSGKSRFGLAATRRLAAGGRAWFLATAWPGDPEMDDRIERHRRERPDDWPTIDVGSDLVAALAQTEPREPVLIDGLTLWLSAVMGDDPVGPDPVLDGPLADALEAIAARPGPVDHRQRRGRLGDRADARRRPHLPRPRRHRPPAHRGPGGRGRPARGRPADPPQGADRVTDGGRAMVLPARLPPTSGRSTASSTRSDRSTRRAMAEAAARLDRLTKPPGSLGQLETVVIELAGITGRTDATVERGVVVVAAADHGVVRQGVSAYPSDVTAQMVANFVAGGAAINVLGGWAGVRVVVVDAGVASPIPSVERRPASVAGAWSGPGSATGPPT